MIDNPTKEKFIQLRAQGKSYDAISTQLGISKPTLIQLSKEFSDTITNLQTIELETLKEKYYIQNTARIKLFGEQVERIVEELGKRDFKDISTEKLLSLLDKYVSSLREGENQFKFVETVEGVTVNYAPPNREDSWNA